MNEDTIFLLFVWLCLAGPLILFGISFIINFRWLMGVAMGILTLVSILGGTNSATEGDPAQPENLKERLAYGVVLVIIGIAVGAFFTGAV